MYRLGEVYRTNLIPTWMYDDICWWGDLPVEAHTITVTEIVMSIVKCNKLFSSEKYFRISIYVTGRIYFLVSDFWGLNIELKIWLQLT